MSPTNQEALAIAELAYWTPALLLTLFISYKHGFGRQAGWILIALLALVRLTGSSCQVAYDSQPLQDRSTELITAAAICNLIGTSFVVSVFIGLLGRV